MDPFVGEIRLFSGSFAPVNWALCDGSLIAIRSNPALYSVIGMTFGGSGTNFALPNLQGSIPMGVGNGPGLTPRAMGNNQGGATSVTLTQAQMANHGHAVNCLAASGGANVAVANYPAASKEDRQTRVFTDSPYNPTSDNSTMNPATIGPAGGNRPHNNMQPYLPLNFIIALQGVPPKVG
jgi:microcystin-dependent protein